MKYVFNSRRTARNNASLLLGIDRCATEVHQLVLGLIFLALQLHSLGDCEPNDMQSEPNLERNNRFNNQKRIALKKQTMLNAKMKNSHNENCKQKMRLKE
jgi:hypothetical protein